jgi:NAD(P)-dependent dehydrogenase (short-subunit alcohol dehydrogenase family)
MARMNKWTPKDIPSQAGKLAIITGANSGIGYHTALELARAGAAVILACRNAQKAEAAKAKLLAALPQASVEVAIVDMADLDSIRKFAEGFVVADRKLDLLINNAGVMGMPQRTPTAQGFEGQFGTNHLGHFALTGELMPALLKTPGSRVVTVASIAHKSGRMRFEDPNWEKAYDPRKAYQQSKLANILFGLELDRRLKRANANVASLIAHPGVATTSIVSNGMGINLKTKIINGLILPLLAQSDARGSWPTLYAATSPDAQSGHYYGPDGIAEIKGTPVEVTPKPQALDPVAAARLWHISEQMTAVEYVGVS